MTINTLPKQSSSKAIFRQYVAAISVAVLMIIVGIGTAWPSPTLLKIRANEAPIQMDNTQISWMVSLLFFGNILSPLPAGWLMDAYGRKITLLSSSIMSLTAWILIWYSKYPWIVYVARFLDGLCAGTAYTIVCIYISEIAEPRIRGSLTNFNNLFRSVGSLFVFVVGPYISYRTLAIICGLLPLFYFSTFSYMPESPYYLIMKKKKDEARKALRWLRGDKEENDLNAELDQIEKAIELQTKNKGTLKDVFMIKGNRKAFIIVEILAFSKNLSGFDVLMAFTSTTLPVDAFQFFGPNECVIVFGAISVFACILSMFLIDRFNRRFLLSLSASGCGLMMLITGMWFFLDEKTEINVRSVSYIPFYCIVLHGIVYSIGLGPIVANVKGELFSASVKGLCSAITSVFYAIISFILNRIYLVLVDNFGFYSNFFIFSISCFLGTVFILVYVVETRGKTLQEIQDILNGVKRKTAVVSA